MKQSETAVTDGTMDKLHIKNTSEFDVSLSCLTGSPPKDCGEFDFQTSTAKAYDGSRVLLKFVHKSETRRTVRKLCT